MKRILYLLLLIFIFTVNAIAQPAITSVLVPQFMADTTKGVGEGPRTPFIYRARITGLTPNATYRYRSQAVCLNYFNGATAASDAATSAGAGNEIFIRQSGNFGYSSSASLSTAGGYDSLLSDASGEYEGWFGIEPTGNARFNAGNYIHPRLVINTGVTGNTTSANYLTIIDSALTMTYGIGTTQGTGIWSKSFAADKNIAVLWDNLTATGRPLSCAIIESEGIAFRSATSPTNYPLFYRNNVDTISGAWGTIIPNNNANGVRRIENRRLTDGTLYYANFDADGIWPIGATSTVNPSGGYTAIKLDSVDVPLIPPSFYFDATTYSINENGTSIDIEVKHKNPAQINTNVDVLVKAGGTATTGIDYTFTTTTLTFTPTDTKKVITIPIINDVLTEGNETFILRLSNPTNLGILKSDSVATITIIDDDFTSPIFHFNQTSYSVNEAGTAITIAVKYKNPSSSATSVNVSVKAGGTAVEGLDYTLATSTLNFAPADTMKTLSIPINNDVLVEGNETFVLRLSNQTSGCVLNADSITTVTIIDDDLAAPSVALSVSKQTVGEGAGSATITVKLSSPAIQASSIAIAASSATATTADYSFTNTTLNFAVGDSVKTTLATITDDALVEGSEFFILQISNPINLTLGTIAADTINITDNDFPRFPIGIISTVNAITGVADSLGKKYDEVGIVYGINYRPAGLQFVIRDNTGGITAFKSTGNYGYSIKEGDSVRIPGTVAQFNGLTEFNADTVILLGSNKAIKTPVVITKLNEVNENDLVRLNGVQLVTPIATWPTAAANISVRNATDTIIIRLQLANSDILGTAAPVGLFDIIGLGSQFDNTNPYLSGYQLFPRFLSDIIVANPPPTITVDALPISINENAGTVSIKLKISNVNGIAASINIANTGTATSGTDYTSSATSATFLANANNGDSIIVTYTIIDDALIEANETIIVGFSVASNASIVGSSKTITINDNDAPANITIDTTTLSVNENAGIVKVKVKISNVNGKATTATLAFTGSAAAGTDYVAPTATITFPASALNGDSILVSYTITDDLLYEPTAETIITTYTAGTNCAISGAAVQTIKIVDNDPNGMDDQSNLVSIKVYPNPSYGELTIQCSEPMISIRLIDLLGHEMQLLQSKSNLVSLQNISQGVYVIIAQTKYGIATQRVIIR